MESKEIPKVDLVFVQNEFQSYVEEGSRLEDSASQEDELESYAYSYSFPAEGKESTNPPTTEDSSVDQADAPVEVEMAIVGPSPPASVVAMLKRLNLANMRILGLLGWTGIAAAGAVAVLLESSPAINLQLVTLSGVWFGVSAAIWFLPAKLAPQTKAAG